MPGELLEAVEPARFEGCVEGAMATTIAAYHARSAGGPHAGSELRLTLLATWDDTKGLDVYCHGAPMPPPRWCV
eukprot:SAG31_NODE_2989_length_4813_cov_8.205346_6_plen_74_part_00